MDKAKEYLSYTKSIADIFLAPLYPCIKLLPVDLTGKRALVTGANVGLGKAIATSLAAQGAEVHLVCRDKAKAECAREGIIQQTGNPNVFVQVVDFGSLANISDFVKLWGLQSDEERQVDILINNAGLMTGSKRTSPEGFEITYAVNALGQFALTIPFLEKGYLSSNARIVQVTSTGMYRGHPPSTQPTNLNSTDLLGDTPEGAELLLSQFYPLYRRSKALQVVFTLELQERLREDPRYSDVVVQSCHPGNVLTSIWSRKDGAAQNPRNARWPNLIGSTFGITPEEGAITPVWLATSIEAGMEENRSGYWDKNVRKWIPAWMHDRGLRKGLWDVMARDAGMQGIY